MVSLQLPPSQAIPRADMMLLLRILEETVEVFQNFPATSYEMGIMRTISPIAVLMGLRFLTIYFGTLREFQHHHPCC